MVAEHAVEDTVEHVAEDEAEHAAEDAASDELGEGANCALSFAAGTLVATTAGLKPIASLKAGDQVKSYDPKGKTASTQTVQATWINHDTDLLDVTLRSTTTSPSTASTSSTTGGHAVIGPVAQHRASASTSANSTTHDETIHTTANHPWLTADRGWAQAGTLTLGEGVVEASGGTAVVVALRDVAGSAPMYDLTVSELHDFAVGNGAYVVHNANCGPQAKGLLNALRGAGADVSHVTVGVGRDEAGNLLVSLNERVAEAGETDLTDKTAQTLQVILERPGWARQGMRYVGPDMLQPAGTAYGDLFHAERYLMDAGAVPNTVGVSLKAGSCDACLRMMGMLK